jgi:hypothetical protein
MSAYYPMPGFFANNGKEEKHFAIARSRMVDRRGMAIQNNAQF